MQSQWLYNDRSDCDIPADYSGARFLFKTILSRWKMEIYISSSEDNMWKKESSFIVFLILSELTNKTAAPVVENHYRV